MFDCGMVVFVMVQPDNSQWIAKENKSIGCTSVTTSIPIFNPLVIHRFYYLRSQSIQSDSSCLSPQTKTDLIGRLRYSLTSGTSVHVHSRVHSFHSVSSLLRPHHTLRKKGKQLIYMRFMLKNIWNCVWKVKLFGLVKVALYRVQHLKFPWKFSLEYAKEWCVILWIWDLFLILLSVNLSIFQIKPSRIRM